MRAFPEEFRRDVVKVARNSKEPRKETAADFGVSPATLSNWLCLSRPGFRSSCFPCVAVANTGSCLA